MVYSANLNGLDRYIKSLSIFENFEINFRILILYRTSNRTKDVRSLEPFIYRFKHTSHEHDSLTIDIFCKLFEDSSVRFIQK